MCQKIIQNSSTKHFSCDVSQHSTESDIKFPVPVITKTAHILYNKEVESTNSLKANVSPSYLATITFFAKIIKDYEPIIFRPFRQTSEKDEDCRSIHNSSMPNDSGLLNDNFHNMQNQHGELRTSILTPTTIRCTTFLFFFLLPSTFPALLPTRSSNNYNSSN